MTPQLLELSGIGKSSVLSQFGIEQLQGMELPVGENLQDHLMISMTFFLTNDTQSEF
jgi:choline dehydrogenase-like flavoprotein